MKKRNIIFGLLPIFAGVTVAGTGFSAWYFGNSTSSNNKTASITVTNKVTGSSTVTINEYAESISLDDPGDQGITWTMNTNADGKDFEFEVTVPASTTVDSSYTKLTTTLVVTIPAACGDYIVFDNTKTVGSTSGTNANQGGTTNDETLTYTLVTNLTTADQVFTYTLPLEGLVKYTSKIESSSGVRDDSFTEDDYDTFKTAANGQNISFDITTLMSA